MIIEINGVEVKFEPTIGSFLEIVRYKQFYEKELAVSLTQYMARVYDMDNYAFDTVCDLIYYPYAQKCKNESREIRLTYQDVFEWLIGNMDKMQDLAKGIGESMPQADKKKEVKKGRKPKS